MLTWVRLMKNYLESLSSSQMNEEWSQNGSQLTSDLKYDFHMKWQSRESH